MNGISTRYSLRWFLTLCFLFPVVAGGQHFGDRETDFVIRLSPVALPHGITATIVTTNLYPCAGYRLRSYSTWEVDTITIHINGMVRPVPCVQVGEVATGSTFLGDLRDSVYYLRVEYRGETDLHRMTVGHGHARARELGARFTSVRGF